MCWDFRECAGEIIERLQGGQEVVVSVVDGYFPPEARRDPALPEYRGAWTGWQDHAVVIEEGRVFDGFGPREGVPAQDWLELWGDPEIIDFGGIQ